MSLKIQRNKCSSPLKAEALIIGLIILCSCEGAKRTSEMLKPNVIIILADDLGYKDVGFNGCQDIQTPNIDRIAAGGVVFSNGYVSYPVCGPSRAGLMTGRYQDRFGFSRNPLFAPKDIKQGLPPDEQTLAEALKREGYRTMAIGKWHLGAHKQLRPLERGFDEFFGFLSGGHRYFPSEWTLNDISEVKAQYDPYKTKLLRNDTRVEEDEYLTQALSREAVNFIGRNQEQPFFLYLAYNAPHGPLQATEKYLKQYEHIDDHKRRTYAAMVTAMDDGIGSLLYNLTELDILDNTVIFFLSDNGGDENLGADNGELKKGKGSLFEGGIRVPFAMQWNSVLPGGMTFHGSVISLDIFATVKACIGMETANELDGVNIVPFLTGDQPGIPQRNLFWRKYDHDGMAIRTNGTKMIRENGSVGLYHLNSDIGEKVSLLNDADSIKFQTLYQNWNAKMSKPAFFGLGQDKDYNILYPDRFKDVEKY
jgi:arylsulfatase A-like enzyme